MTTVFAGSLYQLIRSYRLIWISGKFGASKTLFAFHLAEYFAREFGYRIISNVPSVWCDDLKDVDFIENKFGQKVLRCVVIMDEAGLGLKANRQVESMAAYCRKMDVIYLFPSFFPPIRAAQVCTIQGLFSFMGIGLPYVQYSWQVRLGSFKDGGNFGFLFPQKYWGIYSTASPEGSIEDLIDFLAFKVNQFRELHGQDAISDMGDAVSENERLVDSLGAFSDAADAVASVSVGRRKR